MASNLYVTTASAGTLTLAGQGSATTSPALHWIGGDGGTYHYPLTTDSGMAVSTAFHINNGGSVYYPKTLIRGYSHSTSVVEGGSAQFDNGAVGTFDIESLNFGSSEYNLNGTSYSGISNLISRGAQGFSIGSYTMIVLAVGLLNAPCTISGISIYNSSYLKVTFYVTSNPSLTGYVYLYDSALSSFSDSITGPIY
jgi:hypothetical protein